MLSGFLCLDRVIRTPCVRKPPLKLHPCHSNPPAFEAGSRCTLVDCAVPICYPPWSSILLDSVPNSETLLLSRRPRVFSLAVNGVMNSSKQHRGLRTWTIKDLTTLGFANKPSDLLFQLTTTMNNEQNNPSTLSVHSNATLVDPVAPSRTVPRPQKDYAAAFGALQSRYGTSGHIPNPKKEPSKKLPPSSQPLQSVPALPSGSSQVSQASQSTSTATERSASSSSNKNQPSIKSRDTKLFFLKSIFQGL